MSLPLEALICLCGVTQKPHGSRSKELRENIFWLKDDALEDSANLPAPGIIATEIVEDLRAALAQFEEIEADLKEV